jgi:hypothetical protein
MARRYSEYQKTAVPKLSSIMTKKFVVYNISAGVELHFIGFKIRLFLAFSGLF